MARFYSPSSFPILAFQPLGSLLQVVATSLLDATRLRQECSHYDRRFTWMLNSQAQNPCNLSRTLLNLCNNSGPQNTEKHPPQLHQNLSANLGEIRASSCSCNTVMYSLLFACGLLCDVPDWSLTLETYTSTLGCNSMGYASYTAAVPIGASIPAWAYQPVSSDDKLNVTNDQWLASKSLADATTSGSYYTTLSESTLAAFDSAASPALITTSSGSHHRTGSSTLPASATFTGRYSTSDRSAMIPVSRYSPTLGRDPSSPAPRSTHSPKHAYTPGERSHLVMVATLVGGVIVLSIVIISVLYFLRRRTRRQERAVAFANAEPHLERRRSSPIERTSFGNSTLCTKDSVSTLAGDPDLELDKKVTYGAYPDV